MIITKWLRMMMVMLYVFPHVTIIITLIDDSWKIW